MYKYHLGVMLYREYENLDIKLTKKYVNDEDKVEKFKEHPNLFKKMKVEFLMNHLFPKGKENIDRMECDENTSQSIV